MPVAQAWPSCCRSAEPPRTNSSALVWALEKPFAAGAGAAIGHCGLANKLTAASAICLHICCQVPGTTKGQDRPSGGTWLLPGATANGVHTTCSHHAWPTRLVCTRVTRAAGGIECVETLDIHAQWGNWWTIYIARCSHPGEVLADVQRPLTVCSCLAHYRQ